MKNKGFTLVELLVAVSIIGILASIVVVSLNVARTKGRVAAGQLFDASVLHGIGDQLIAEWTFDNVDSPWGDTSGNGHDGSCTSCPTVETGYNNKTAYNYNGSTNSINIGVGNNYFPLSTFTICAWEKTPGLGTGMTINGIISITYGLILEITSTGLFQTRIDDGSSVVSVAVAGNLHDDQFHNLCLTYDGLKRYMYVDGALKGVTATTWLGTTRWPTGSTAIGLDVNNTSKYRFNGLIDDIRIYASALNLSQIEKLYAEGKDFYLAKNR